jgi:hypothetical protein
MVLGTLGKRPLEQPGSRRRFEPDSSQSQKALPLAPASSVMWLDLRLNPPARPAILCAQI